MISYTEIQKNKESSFRRDPIKWAHRKVIVIAKVNSKLCFEVLKRVIFVSSIKVFIILAVGTFRFAVMARSERTNQLVGNISLFERALKERKIVGRRTAEAFGELKTVVGLNALDGKAELLKVIEHMNQKLCRGVGTVLLKSFKVTVS